jgi:hypothetical protein
MGQHTTDGGVDAGQLGSQHAGDVAVQVALSHARPRRPAAAARGTANGGRRLIGRRDRALNTPHHLRKLFQLDDDLSAHDGAVYCKLSHLRDNSIWGRLYDMHRVL